MRHISNLIFILTLVSCVLPANNWLDDVPSSVGSRRDWSVIPEDAFFEVSASKLSAAETWLSDQLFLALDENGLVYFGRPDFMCLESDKPYLVRAEYINGGTGKFKLLWANDAVLVVAHGSLGPDGPSIRSAIIACLPMKPAAVFSSISGAL